MAFEANNFVSLRSLTGQDLLKKLQTKPLEQQWVVLAMTSALAVKLPKKKLRLLRWNMRITSLATMKEWLGRTFRFEVTIYTF